jgi:hypothetical protein
MFDEDLTSEVISTLGMSCCRKRERSGRCKASAAASDCVKTPESAIR